MSIYVFDADLTVTSGNAITASGDDNDVLVSRDADIVATTGYGIFSTGVSTVTVLGSVAGFGSAVYLAANGQQSLYVGKDAYLSSLQTATGNVTVYSDSGAKTLVNAGTIAGPAKIGLLLRGDDNSITNTGHIEASSAVLMGFSHGLRAVLFNSGVISANSYTPSSASAFSNCALYVDGADARIINAAGGLIESVAAGGVALRLTSFADNSVVVNHGTLVAQSASTAIDASDLTGISARQTFTNTGLVQGNQYAYLGSLAMNSVTNRGHMIGDVQLGDGADRFDGRGGVVTGIVFGGLGDDQYLLSSDMTEISELGGGGIDTVSVSYSYELQTGFEKLILLGTGDLRGYGNALNNRISGNAGDNRLNGEAGNDTITGGAGADAILGWTGNDVMNGDSGNDTLWGGDGNDTTDGGDGDDVLTAGLGSDWVYGAAGDDTLIGGGSGDTLLGGSGEDVFIFASVAHIGKLVGSRDMINDFAHGLDLIDLGRIDANTLLAGNQAFSFVGAAALGGAAGKLQYVQATGLLSGDVNGDGVADFVLQLSSKPVLTVTDILL